MYEREPQQYTVQQRKEILRENGLAVAGSKAELINRLTEFNGEIWNQLNEQRREQRLQLERANIGDGIADGEQRILAQDPANIGDGIADGEQRILAQDPDGGNGDGGSQGDGRIVAANGAGENDLLVRELALLRRERDVASRALELLRRERSTASVDSGITDETRSFASTTMNIRSLKDLMSDFDGDGKLFTTWKQQFVLLKNSYRLDHETAQVLMSTKLKGRALTWFHSKPEHLTMTMSD